MNALGFIRSSKDRTSYIYLSLIAICALTFYLRLSFFGQYIDSDVGNMAYIGWRMSEGEILLDIEGPGKPPLYPMAYALFIKIFGPSFIGIKWFGTIFIILSVLSIYWLTRKSYGEKTAVLASLLFGIFSSSPMVEGETVNLETIMHLPYILATGFFINAKIQKSLRYYFYAGLFGSLAMLVKQVGGVVFFLFLFSELLDDLKRKELFFHYIMIGTGASIPIIGFVVFYIFHNYSFKELFDSLLISNFRYIRRGYEYTNFFKNFLGAMKLILRENSLLWLGWIFSSFCFIKKIINNKAAKHDIVVMLWALISFAVLWVSGTFYAHYFLQLIAPFSVLTAYAIMFPWKYNLFLLHPSGRIVKFIWIMILAISTLFFIKTDYLYFFKFTPVEQTIYQIPSLGSKCIEYGVYNIVQEEIASYIKKETMPDETIYIWGIAPQTYFLAQRRAATRYRNNFNLSEIVTGKPLEELRTIAPIVINEIKRSKPVFIVEIIPLIDFPDLQKIVEKYYELDKLIEFPTPPYKIFLYRRVRDIEDS